MMPLGMTIVQLLMAALHEAPTLIDDGKALFQAIAGSGDQGLQHVANAAAALRQLADHAAEAAAQATGNPDAVPAPQAPAKGDDAAQGPDTEA